MVHTNTTSSWLNDTPSVGLENSLISFNTDWDGLSGNSGYQLRWWVFGDGSSTWELSLSSSSNVVASATSTSVWIITFTFNFVFNGVFESIFWESSIAAKVALGFWTINKLLFWEGYQWSFLDLVDTFNGTSSWESPTWTARSLILYTCDGSWTSPVNGCWGINYREFSDGQRFFTVSCWGVISLDHTEFVVRVISELCDTFSVAFFLNIVVLDVFKDLCEEGESEFVFFFCAITSSVFSNEVNEFSFSLGEGSWKESWTRLNLSWVQDGKGTNGTSYSYGSKNLFSTHLGFRLFLIKIIINLFLKALSIY